MSYSEEADVLNFDIRQVKLAFTYPHVNGHGSCSSVAALCSARHTSYSAHEHLLRVRSDPLPPQIIPPTVKSNPIRVEYECDAALLRAERKTVESVIWQLINAFASSIVSTYEYMYICVCANRN